jgi:hypothetical protein
MMSSLQRLTGFAILALSIGACAPVRVHSFAERGADFNRYRTYKFGPADPAATGDPRLDNNPFFNQRIQADVDKEMAARGFEKVKSGRADLLVHYHASVSQEIEVKDDVDRRYDRGYCQTDDCRPYVYDAGTLLIDFVDLRTNKLIWRGWAEESLDGVIDDQSWMEKKIDDSVKRILAKLPPRA